LISSPPGTEMFQFPGLLGYSGLDARWAAPPDFSQPSTPDLLMTPRHPPRALRSLTTPIGPPLLVMIPGEPGPFKVASTESTGISTSKLWITRPSVSRRGGRPQASHVSVRVHLTRPARLTSSRTVFLLYCSGDCHSPYFACDRNKPGKPDPLPPHAGVCFVCDQHRIAKKHQPGARLRREGGSNRRLFLVWPGGEAVKHGPAPRSAETADCIHIQKPAKPFKVIFTTTWASPQSEPSARCSPTPKS
jgi:hypothetical protein